MSDPLQCHPSMLSQKSMLLSRQPCACRWPQAQSVALLQAAQAAQAGRPAEADSALARALQAAASSDQQPWPQLMQAQLAAARGDAEQVLPAHSIAHPSCQLVGSILAYPHAQATMTALPLLQNEAPAALLVGSSSTGYAEASLVDYKALCLFARWRADVCTGHGCCRPVPPLRGRSVGRLAGLQLWPLWPHWQRPLGMWMGPWTQSGQRCRRRASCLALARPGLPQGRSTARIGCCNAWLAFSCRLVPAALLHDHASKDIRRPSGYISMTLSLCAAQILSPCQASCIPLHAGHHDHTGVCGACMCTPDASLQGPAGSGDISCSGPVRR